MQTSERKNKIRAPPVISNGIALKRLFLNGFVSVHHSRGGETYTLPFVKMFRHVTSCYSLTIINKNTFSRAWPPRILSPFGLLLVLNLLLIEIFF